MSVKGSLATAAVIRFERLRSRNPEVIRSHADLYQRTRFPAPTSSPVFLAARATTECGYLGVARVWSHDFWSIWDFVAVGSGT
jgi:hypothetical protein